MRERCHLSAHRRQNAEEGSLRDHPVSPVLRFLHRLHRVSHLRLRRIGVAPADQQPRLGYRCARRSDEVWKRSAFLTGRTSRARHVNSFTIPLFSSWLPALLPPSQPKLPVARRSHPGAQIHACANQTDQRVERGLRHEALSIDEDPEG